MKIVDAEVYSIDIPFKETFELSRGFVGSKALPGEHVYVKLVTNNGLVGWGEARPMHTWMYETRETVTSTIEKYILPILRGADLSRRLDIESRINLELAPAVTRGQPFAKSAVEVALLDLLGKEAGRPVHWFLGGKRQDYVDIAYIISTNEESVEEEAKEGLSKGYSLLKAKINGNVEHDTRLLHRVSKAAGSKPICADANQAYDIFRFKRLLSRIDDIENLIFIEQPLETSDQHGQRQAAASSKFPIGLDESVYTARDLLRFVDTDSTDAVVLKIAKSGLAENQRIIALAQAAGVSILGSGMTESGIALAAAIHLFSTAGLQAPADLNGPQFLSHLLVKDLSVEDGRIKVPDRPGLGVTVDEGKLAEFRVKPNEASKRSRKEK